MSIKVDGLSKKFCRNLKKSLWYGVLDLAKEGLLIKGGRTTLRDHEFWALKNISFQVQRGETFGIIGHNGAGKSTLLKVINGLIRPDMGTVSIYGKIGALIDLGMGFSSILTGRENIYTNAVLLGLSRKEIALHMDRIIEFAGIGDFIDAPLQTYSSGMKVRLGFSIAVHLNPDVLLIDEVLSVGDAAFRERCYQHLANFKQRGGTIFFISHNTGAVESICDRVMLLDHGKIVDIGAPVDLVNRYEKQALEISRKEMAQIANRELIQDNADVHFVSAKCLDLQGHEKNLFRFEEPMKLRLEFHCFKDLENPTFYVCFQKGLTATPFALVHTTIPSLSKTEDGRSTFLECIIENPRISSGSYELVVGVKKSLSTVTGQKYYAHPRLLAHFEISREGFINRYPHHENRLLFSAPVAWDYKWQIKDLNTALPQPAGLVEMHP